MKLRATRNFLNDVGMVRRGSEVDIRDVHANSLIKRGLAVALDDEGEDKPAPAERRKGKPKTQKAGAAAPSEGE
jgi:hypothetical protein